jgi:hypothetical protein
MPAAIGDNVGDRRRNRYRRVRPRWFVLAAQPPDRNQLEPHPPSPGPANRAASRAGPMSDQSKIAALIDACRLAGSQVTGRLMRRIKRGVEYAPRLDPLRAALARLDAAQVAKDPQGRPFRAERKASPNERPRSRSRRPRRPPKPTSGRGDKAKGPARRESAGPRFGSPLAGFRLLLPRIASMQS